MPWADKKTGHSPHFWGRAMGWYAMALVDVLDYFPTNHPKRSEIEVILQRLAAAAVKAQDPKSGVWFQILDKNTDLSREHREGGNYLEASGSSMFCYALLKGVRQGVLDKNT